MTDITADRRRVHKTTQDGVFLHEGKVVEGLQRREAESCSSLYGSHFVFSPALPNMELQS